MHMAQSGTNSGFSLLEVLLAASLFSVFVGAFTVTLILGQETAATSGERARAVELANEGIEAARNLRDASPTDPFSSLPTGTHGLALSGGVWTLSGSSDTTGIFTRELAIASADSNTRQVTTTVTWDQTQARSGETVSLVSYLTDWLVSAESSLIRATEYYVEDGNFSGTSYTLDLNQDLEDNYFVIVQGSDGDGSSNNNRGPDENYVALTGDPNGTGDLSASGGTDQLAFTRGNAVNSWVGVITVVECVSDCNGSGFSLLDVQRVSHGSGNTSGSDTSGTSWSDINQVMLMGGFNGAGCDTTESNNNNHPTCHARIYPSGTEDIEWTRDSGGSTLGDATSTVMVVDWGSAWTVQRVNVTGSNGGNGADDTGEYDTASISSVARANTWVWGTGHTDDNGIGDAAEASLITLGDGVNENTDETSVAVGQEYGVNKDFEVYALTHDDLAVDYEFKADGNTNDLTYDASVTAATNSTARMALIYNGQNGTGGAFPRPFFSARYTDSTTIQAERRRSGQPWPAWIQGIDFSALEAVPGWSVPALAGSLNISGNNNGWKVDVSGDYAYLVRQGGNPEFIVIDVSDTASPSVAWSGTITGGPEDIQVVGDYAYIATDSNSSELQIYDISTPTSPSLVGSFNTSSNRDAYGVYVVDDVAYTVHDSQGGFDELQLIDVSTPSSPSGLGSIDIGADANEVYVSGNYAYVANDGTELEVIDVSNTSSPSNAGSLDLSGGDNAETITGFGDYVFVGRSNGDVAIVDVSTPSSPSLLATYDAQNTVRDLDAYSGNNLLFIASDENSAEIQIVDVSTPASPTLRGSYDGSSDVNGVAYETGNDFLVGAAEDNSEELIILTP